MPTYRVTHEKIRFGEVKHEMREFENFFRAMLWFCWKALTDVKPCDQLELLEKKEKRP